MTLNKSPPTAAIMDHFNTCFGSFDVEILPILCAIRPVMNPMQNFKKNVLGAPAMYSGINKSPIVIPMAPPIPPKGPPKSNAPSTHTALPRWILVAPAPGSVILICRNVKTT